MDGNTFDIRRHIRDAIVIGILTSNSIRCCLGKRVVCQICKPVHEIYQKKLALLHMHPSSIPTSPIAADIVDVKKQDHRLAYETVATRRNSKTECNNSNRVIVNVHRMV